MKPGIIAAICLSLALAASCWAGGQPDVKDQVYKDSYSLGHQYGELLKKHGWEISIEVFERGLRDGYNEQRPEMSREDIYRSIIGIRQKVTAARVKEHEKISAVNMEEGQAFLEKNKANEGVKILSSGLQYEVLRQGNGRSPGANDTVITNYRGTLINGTEFDSSYKRGKPETFSLQSVIPAWTEALQLMREGSKWKLFVPPELAYGEAGKGSRIPPNSTLIFEIELLSVKDGEKENLVSEISE